MKIQQVLRQLLTTHTSSHEIALGVAVGVFIGCTPFYGLHTAIFLIFAILIRPANKLAMFVGTNISLPPTLPLISWAGYSIGRCVLQGDYPPIGWSMLKNLSIKDLLDLFYPLLVGSLIFGILAGLFFYFFVRLAIVTIRSKEKWFSRATANAQDPVAQENATSAPPDDAITIRPYQEIDREDVRRISCETAFLGFPISLFIDDKTLVADALTRYYTDFEPESCLVAVANKQVVGYLLGSKDVAKANRIFRTKIAWALLWHALQKGTLLKKTTIKFLCSVAQSFFKNEFASPDFSHDYPATLHINITKNFHRQNIGSQLITAYQIYLQQNNIPGVHFGTISDNAKVFFLKSGFTPLHQGRRSYLKHITNSTLNYYIFGKKFL